MINESELPAGWQLCRIADVCTVNPSKREITDVPDDIEVTFVPMAAVDEATRTIKEPETRLLGEVRRGYAYFAEGDVLFAKITPSMENGKAAIARGLKNGLGMGSTEFHVLRPGQNVMAEWIYRYIGQEWFRDLAASHFTGSVGQQRVPRGFVENHELPIPPLNEQRRIVARLGELTERIDAARRLRAEAVEEAAVILPSALAEVFGEAEEEGWEVRRLGEVANPVNGFGFPKEYQGHQGLQYPFAKVSDMNLPGNEIYLSEAVNTVDDSLLKQIRAKTYPAGTVIFPKIGGAVATNKKRILATEATFDNNVMGVIPGPLLSTKWLYYYLMSIDLMTLARATTMPSIRQSDIADLDMPLPSLNEQHRTVEYLDAVQAKVEAIRRYQAETQAEIEAMTGAVLERVFRGEA